MSVKPIPQGYHTVTPYILVDGCHKFIEFLEKAFSAKVNNIHETNGKVLNAEISIGDSLVMVGDAPQGHKPNQAMFYLYVEDVDAMYKQAVSEGGESVQEPEDMFYGDRSGAVKDFSGNVWWIATHIKDVSEEELKEGMKKKKM
ncbi:MAG: VOC family protein [Bacteroidetes bacterium]|nr:VOC family protein [Bacteroidota bacterium]